MIGAPRTREEQFFLTELHWLRHLAVRGAIGAYRESHSVDGTTVRPVLTAWGVPDVAGDDTLILGDQLVERPRWANYLTKQVLTARRCVVTDARLTLTWPTTQGDQEWRGPGQRSPFMVLNAYEVLNLLADPDLGVSRVMICGYPHPRPQGFKRIPMPWTDVYAAGLLIVKGPGPMMLACDPDADITEDRYACLACRRGIHEGWAVGTPGREWWP